MKTKIKIQPIYLVAGGVALIVLVMVLMLAYNNHKYRAINNQVSESVEKYLQEYLGTTLQSNVSAGTIENEQDQKKGVEEEKVVQISKKEKEEIIKSVLGSVTPTLQAQLASNTSTVREQAIKELETTIDERVKGILSENDNLTDAEKDIIVKEVTVSVESKILEVLKENYTEMTNSITTLEKTVQDNLDDIRAKLEEYKTQMSTMEKDISDLKSKLDKLNVQTGSDNSSLNSRLESVSNNYTLLQNAFQKYINEMNTLLSNLGLSGNSTNLVTTINDLSVSLQAADEELSKKMDEASQNLQNQINNNKAKIDNLDKLQNELDKYIKAVESGDEAARDSLKAQIEKELGNLDSATRKSIEDVLNNAATDKDELQKLIDQANTNLNNTKNDLLNNVTENSVKIADLDQKITNNTQMLDNQLANNSEKIKNLDQISDQLDKYIKAVESGDQEARDNLRSQIEASMSNLDENTKKKIQDVLDSAADNKAEMQELIDQANTQITSSKEELSNQITALSGELDNMKESIMRGEFSTDSDGTPIITITVPIK